MKNLYPLKLKGYSKSAIWGGQLLLEKYGKTTDEDNIGESWELTCREKEKSIIENGNFAGKTINEYIEENGNSVIGTNFESGRFPLLIKLLNSATPLSVQVHPDDAYALEHENEYGKTEMWYIMEADKDSELVIGVKNYNKEKFKNAAEKGELEDYLVHVKVKPGDFFFIPSGLVHAIGAGILLCEVQQNSDVTYRVYDYNRTDSHGNRRELHLNSALDVIREYGESEIEKLTREFKLTTPVSADAETLVACPKFAVEKVKVNNSSVLFCDSTSFLSLTITKSAGEGKIMYGGEEFPFKLGETYFIPAGLGEFTVNGDAEIICASIKR